MITYQQSNLKELRHLVVNKDLNLASRQLLDFITDHAISSELLRESIDLRAKYNELLAQNECKPSQLDELQVDFLALIEKIESELQKDTIQTGNHSDTSVFTQNNKQAQSSLVFQGLHITKQYSSVGFKLDNIHLNMNVGEITGIVGENGNGKTTLLRIVSGDLSIDQGEVHYPGFPMKKFDWYKVKQNIAFIPQHLKNWRGTLKDNLHFSASNHGIYGRENEQIVDYIIHRLGLTRYRNAGWSEISSGYKLRFELAKALVWHPKLLILDEPLANLDINTKLLFMQDLRLLANSSRYPISILMSSQQLHEIESVVDNIIFLKEGNCLYNGKVSNFGDNRASNTFEIFGNFGRTELTQLMRVFEDVEIEETGQSFW